MGKVVYNGSKTVAQYQWVTAKAEADSGYVFSGWYYANGDLFSNDVQLGLQATNDTTSLFARFRKFDYVCVPQSGVDTLNLKAGEKVKFYDYGGPKEVYPDYNSGVLVINAPEGYVIEISGKYDVQWWNDYIHLYNGADNHIAEWTGKDSASIIIPNTVAGVRFNSYYNYNQQAGFELQAAAVKLADAVQYKVDVAVNDTALGNAFVNYFVKVDSSSYDVVLSAQAKRGGRFSNWMGDYLYSDPTITVKSDTILKAAFDTVQSYTVTFQSNDTTLGYVQGYKSGVYYEGDWVYIEACTKSAASSFVKWSDGVKDSWRSFYPKKDTTLVAEFKRNDVCKVNINVNDSTLGNVVIGDTGTYYVGQEIYFRAENNEGAFFLDWSDGSTDYDRWIILTGDTTITANFEAMPYKVNVQINDSAAGGVYSYASRRINSHVYMVSVGLNYTKSGYVFKNWSDGYVSTNRDIYVTSDTTIVANFEPIYYDIKYVSENGNINRYVPQVTDSVFIVQTSVFANEGYCFAGWHDSVMLTSRTFAVNSDTALTAKFVKFPYNVNLVCDSVKGSVSYSTQNSTLEKPQIEISVSDNDGYVFTHWSNGSNERNITVTLSSDTTITAYFDELAVKVLLAVNDTAMGTVGHSVYGWSDNYVEMEFWANPKPFYHFVMWSDSVTRSSRYGEFTSDTAFTAIFAPNRYAVSLAANDTAMGSVRVSADTADYRSTDTLFATPAAGYHFVMWNDSVTENPRVITINGNMKFTAIFEINTYKVEFAAENGTVDGAGVFTHGDTATFTAKAAEGYHFSKWSDGNTDNPRTLVVTDSVKFTAVFDINVYKVEAKAENGTVEGAGEYKHGEVATLTAKAADGYHFSKWSDGNTDNPRKVTVTDNVSLTAVFEQDAPSTAIDESTENAVNIFAYSNVIVVENADAEIYIYDSMGRLVERSLGNDARVEIIVNNGGVYIVKVGNTTKRVMVND
jgi:hypothetical protein